MRALLIGLLGLVFASAAEAQAPACPPLPGVERLWERPETRFVLLGEYHGTVETPVLFGDLVCHAAATGRPLRVGIEFFEGEQPLLDRFMAGGDETYAPGQTYRHHGTRSTAMFAMLERLRALKRSGAPLEVFAFVRDSERGHNQTPHELAMAAVWREQAAARRGTLVLVLVGRLHALKTPKALGMDYLPAAALLPQESTTSLITNWAGGETWACVGGQCGAHSFAKVQPGLPRGVHLRPEPGMDGRFAVGAPYTASPPAPGTVAP